MFEKNSNLHVAFGGVVIGALIVIISLAICHLGFKKAANYRVEKMGLGMHMMYGDKMMMKNDDMMHAEMNSMMAGLSGKTGDDFDKAFLKEMITHHEGAVEMANAVIKTSSRPELIQLAKDIITAQTKEIDMMKNWQAAWFK